MTEMTERVADTRCEVCKRQFMVMKRCTRCKLVLYCSRECQVKDWSTHKTSCQPDKALPGADSAETSSTSKSAYSRDDHSIFDEEKDNLCTASSTPTVQHPPLVDFAKKKTTAKDSAYQQPEGKFYLNNSQFHTDVPEVNDQLPKSQITVKCHKEKHKLCVQNSWTGEDIYKFLACSLKLPLDKLKLIHKGKVLNQENICETIKDKAVYQVIGEPAESEAGIDQRDISVMMKQMGLERNAAIKVLRNKGDLLDALLDQ